MTVQKSGSQPSLSRGRWTKRRKWIFITLGILLVVFLIMQVMGGGDKEEKVATEKAANEPSLNQ